MDKNELQYNEVRRKELYRDIAKTAVAIWGRDKAKEELGFYVSHLFQAQVACEDLEIDELNWLLRSLKDRVPAKSRILLEDFF